MRGTFCFIFASIFHCKYIDASNIVSKCVKGALFHKVWRIVYYPRKPPSLASWPSLVANKAFNKVGDCSRSVFFWPASSPLIALIAISASKAKIICWYTNQLEFLLYFTVIIILLTTIFMSVRDWLFCCAEVEGFQFINCKTATSYILPFQSCWTWVGRNIWRKLHPTTPLGFSCYFNWMEVAFYCHIIL